MFDTPAPVHCSYTPLLFTASVTAPTHRSYTALAVASVLVPDSATVFAVTVTIYLLCCWYSTVTIVAQSDLISLLLHAYVQQHQNSAVIAAAIELQ